MGDYCVACGRELPTESTSHICRDCKLTADCEFMTWHCPECGKKMEIMYHHVTAYQPPLVENQWRHIEVDLIYHCDHCGCDWDSYYSEDWGDKGQSVPKRHFWG